MDLELIFETAVQQGSKMEGVPAPLFSQGYYEDQKRNVCARALRTKTVHKYEYL